MTVLVMLADETASSNASIELIAVVGSLIGVVFAVFAVVPVSSLLEVRLGKLPTTVVLLPWSTFVNINSEEVELEVECPRLLELVVDIKF